MWIAAYLSISAIVPLECEAIRTSVTAPQIWSDFRRNPRNFRTKRSPMLRIRWLPLCWEGTFVSLRLHITPAHILLLEDTSAIKWTWALVISWLQSANSTIHLGRALPSHHHIWSGNPYSRPSWGGFISLCFFLRSMLLSALRSLHIARWGASWVGFSNVYGGWGVQPGFFSRTRCFVSRFVIQAYIYL